MTDLEPARAGDDAGTLKATAPGDAHQPSGGRDDRHDPMTLPGPGARPAVNRALTPRRRRRVTENDEYAAFARRVVRAWADRVAAGDIDAIADMAAAISELEDALRVAVTGLRDKGYSWADIGDRLGVTRQAAQQRWRTTGRDLPGRARPRSAGHLPDGGHLTPPRRALNRAGARAPLLAFAARYARPPCLRRHPGPPGGDRAPADWKEQHSCT